MRRAIPRKHILFPSVAEADKKSCQIHSDHLLILARADFGEDKASINLLSLNVLGPGSPMCGFHDKRDWERVDDTVVRYKKMVLGLRAGIEKHRADIIALQETTPQYIIASLKENLPPGWEIISDERAGLITCFNGNRFTLEDKSLDENRRIRSLKLKDCEDGKIVSVNNIWGIYDPFPHLMEEHLKLLLAKEEYSIVIGDTNSRIAPIDNEPRNITTGIIPLLLNVHERLPADLQRSDHPDGGFCRDARGQIHQLPTQTLNYETAEIVVDDRSAEESQAWPEFRMVLCLDDHYTQARMLDEKTIFEYQANLKERFGEDIVVRMASDCFNHKAVGIRFLSNSPLYKHLVSELNATPGFQNKLIAEGNDSGRVFPVVFVAAENIELLLGAINAYRKDIQAKKSGTSRHPQAVQPAGQRLFKKTTGGKASSRIHLSSQIIKK